MSALDPRILFNHKDRIPAQVSSLEKRVQGVERRGTGNFGGPPTAEAAPHNHDDRYYTETEVDAALTGKAPTAHTHTAADVGAAPAVHHHDDRYYTEAETDTLLGGKVSDTDPRLSDARTPVSHAASHAKGGTDVLTPLSIGAVHSTDDRLSDTRVPKPHRASHATGGTDALTAADIGAAPASHTHTKSQITDFTHSHPLGELSQSSATDGQVIRWDSVGGAWVPRLITDANIAAANKDGSASTPSMRTLGTGSTQAAPGNHNHDAALTNAGYIFVPGDVKQTAIPVTAGSEPNGWLLCDGRAVSRTGYANLFNAIGTAYGTPPDTLTFLLPDMRSRVPMGAGQGIGLTNRALGAKGGNERVTLTSAESGLPAHGHGNNFAVSNNIAFSAQVDYNDNGSHRHWNSPNTVAEGTEFQNGTYSYNLPKTGGVSISGAVSDNAGAAAAQSHDNVQPWTTFNYLIKY